MEVDNSQYSMFCERIGILVWIIHKIKYKWELCGVLVLQMTSQVGRGDS